MPGGVSGTVEVAVETDGPSDKTTTIVVDPASLTLSQAEVAPNASIIISGSGFNEGALIPVENIEMDDEPLVVDDAGTVSCDREISPSRECVKVTSSGEFTATVRVWTAYGDAPSGSNANPALDDGDYTIKVKDEDGFEGKGTITILEPTVKVTPETASPRDFIVISGENWPISTPMRTSRSPSWLMDGPAPPTPTAPVASGTSTSCAPASRSATSTTSRCPSKTATATTLKRNHLQRHPGRTRHHAGGGCSRPDHLG